ncbi:MAG: hypothetical protein H0W94_05820 [Actinobacteria bacterium]|nr:hypothetical protein [Actinomycetota bacterium]
MLRACGRLLKPGGRTAFFTIFVSPGLSRRDHRRAVRAGPRAVTSRREHRPLLEAAGFVEIEETDVTEEFWQTCGRWIQHAGRLERDLRAALGSELFDEQQADRRAMLAAIEEGLLSRSLFVARTPA